MVLRYYYDEILNFCTATKLVFTVSGHLHSSLILTLTLTHTHIHTLTHSHLLVTGVA